MSKSNVDPLILLDADVIRHFIHAGMLGRLAGIFPGRFVVLDKVKNELRSTKIKPLVEAFIKNDKIVEMTFPTDMKIIMEYAYLCRDFGEGESACMAVAKHQRQFIASSNLKDIAKFCHEHQITYFTTMDLLQVALNNQYFTKAECNQFIKDVISKGSKLPHPTMDEFIQRKK